MKKQSMYHRTMLVLGVLGAIAGMSAYILYHAWLPIPQGIAEIVHYADTVPESLAIDNDDWWDPDFSSWYREDAQTMHRYLARLGVATGLYQHLSQLLDRATNQLKSEHCPESDYTVLLHPKDEATIYLWGSLQGSLHALARTLVRLREQGVLSDELTLIREDDYFIFNGDVISRSAYSLETLTIVIQLMLQNPGRVFYIRGRQETDSYWHNFGIKRELRYALQKTDINDIELAEKLDAFFALLPVAFAIDDTTQQERQYILIHSGFNGARYSDLLRFVHCLPEKDAQVVNCCMSPEREEGKRHLFTTIIRSHLAAPLPSTKVGVSSVEPFQEATVFFVLSAHNAAYRELFGITQDSVAVLSKNPQSQRWVMRDFRAEAHDTFAPFKVEAEYDVESGYKKTLLSELKVSAENAIMIATPLDQHQDLAFASARVAAGAYAAITLLNQQGGIAGRAVELFLQRNRFDRSSVASMIEHMKNAGVAIIASPLGTDLLAILTQELQKKDLPLLLPIAVPDLFRDSNVLFYRPSYAQQARALISHLIATENAQSFTIVYANDALGISASEAAQAILKEKNIEAVSLIRYEAQSPEFKGHVEAIRAAEQDVICIFGQPSAAMTLIRQVGVQSIVFDTLAGTSDLNTPEMAEFLRTKGLSMAVSNVVPNPAMSNGLLAEKFRSYARQGNVEMDVMSFEGFINIMLVAILIEEAQQKKPDLGQSIFSPELLGIDLHIRPPQSMHETIWICTLPHQESQSWYAVSDYEGDGQRA